MKFLCMEYNPPYINALSSIQDGFCIIEIWHCIQSKFRSSWDHVDGIKYNQVSQLCIITSNRKSEHQIWQLWPYTGSIQVLLWFSAVVLVIAINIEHVAQAWNVDSFWKSRALIDLIDFLLPLTLIDRCM